MRLSRLASIADILYKRGRFKMVFESATRARLLGSIEANRLVLLCGAGLSMPPPSALMSAVGVCRACYDKYQPIEALPANMREDIEQLAGHFYGRRQFESVFINSLVPWDDLVGQPNGGHSAVADFLICRAADAALSANFDTLIEHWASTVKISMRGAINGHEVMAFGTHTSPLVKFHGCLERNREETLWTQLQLSEPKIADRVKRFSNWMELELPAKDLLVIGFWTDWGYLNDVLVNALNVSTFGSVTVVDPASSGTLQAKAPTLWARLRGGTGVFEHVQASGAEALEELRTEFSKVWLRRFYALGKFALEEEGKTYTAVEPSMGCEDLYHCRRDAEGVPYYRAATRKEPQTEAAAAAFVHLLLIQACAVRHGPWYEFRGKRIRVVHGAGRTLNTVREKYKEPPAMNQPDVVVCAGAFDLAVPGRIIASGVGSSIVRPSAGGVARWITVEQARGELGI
jgi:hypothetical protein